jgi:hypothetical protein
VFEVLVILLLGSFDPAVLFLAVHTTHDLSSGGGWEYQFTLMQSVYTGFVDAAAFFERAQHIPHIAYMTNDALSTLCIVLVPAMTNGFHDLWNLIDKLASSGGDIPPFEPHFRKGVFCGAYV